MFTKIHAPDWFDFLDVRTVSMQCKCKMQIVILAIVRQILVWLSKLGTAK